MPRYLKIILWIFLGLILATVLCVVLAATFNWNYAKPWLNRQATELAGRPVAVQGDLSLHWLKPQQGQHGWRAWVPVPQIHAEQITIGNPAWDTSGKNMADVQELTLVLNPLALLGQTVQLPSLKVKGGRFLLQRQPDGKNNWTFTKEGDTTPSKWKFDLQKLELNDISVQVRDQAQQLDLTAEVNSLQQATQQGYGIAWKAQGSYNGAKVSGEGQAGDVLSLQQGSAPFPLQGKVKVGATTIGVEGSLTRPQSLAALDLRLSLAGDTMANLRPLIGVTLPNTPAYHTEGHLIGMLEGDNDKWTYENFKGVVGKSDLEGTLEYQVRKPRSLLTGQVQSKLLRLQDLGPLIGLDDRNIQSLNQAVAADSAKKGSKDQDKQNEQDSKGREQQKEQGQKDQGKQESGKNLQDSKRQDSHDSAKASESSSKSRAKASTKVKQPADKALPVDPINTAAWGTMDADVKFKGDKILRNKDLPLDNIEAQIKLNDKVLSFTPLNFGVAGGTVANTLVLDGRAEQVKGNLTISARHLKMKKLLPGAESMKASFGELHGDAKLSAQGRSIAELMAHSNGELKAVVSEGTISRLLLETAGLNVANIVMVKLFGDKQIVLNCLAADFNVSNGLAKVQAFRLETEDAIVDVTGQINLATERLDLDVKPENKTLRIFTLRSPLYVKGTFKHPDVGVQAAPLAARAGAAVVLGIVATPFAALLPLLNMGTNDSRGCGSLMANVKKPPKAPPAGQKKKAEPNAAKAAQASKNKPAASKKSVDTDRSKWPSSKALP